VTLVVAAWCGWYVDSLLAAVVSPGVVAAWCGWYDPIGDWA
jgi:hypothetical protein